MWPTINDGAEQRWISERIYRPRHGPWKDLQQSSWSKHIFSCFHNQTDTSCISWTPNQPVEKKPNGTCSSGFPMTLSINTSSSRQLCCHGDEKMWQLLRRGAIAGFALLKIIGIGHWVSISYRLWILSITEKFIVSSQNFESTLTLQLLLYNGFKLSPWTRTKRSKNDMYVYVIYEIYIVYNMLSCVLYIYII